LRDANLRARFGLTVVAISHGMDGEERLPNPEYPLSEHDVLVVVGLAEDIERFQASDDRPTLPFASPSAKGPA
jgi:K+/H+ antiporter YhaU regulatory subunit KhtT